MAGQLTEVLAEISTRMAFHVGGGEMLAGYTWSEIPEESIKGVSDLPAARMFTPRSQEGQGDGLVDTTMTVRIMLYVDRTQGSAAATLKAETLADAIETNTASEVDKGLSKTVRKPIDIVIDVGDITLVSIGMQITVSAKPSLRNRGKRRT